MSSTGRGIGVLAAVGCAVAVLLGAPPAGADTIEVKAGPLLAPQPSQADLSTSWQVGEPAFVGSVLLPGALGGCPADYASAIALPGAHAVLAEQVQPPGPPHGGEAQPVGEGVGQFTTLPTGAYSLCAWIQPQGNLAGAAASAAAGPARLTVGGPTGSTTVISPAAPEPEAVQIPVSYTLGLAAGEVPGLATASIGAWASPTPPESCHALPAGTVSLSSPAPRALTATGAPVGGTIDFTGRLHPGVWTVCAYLLQTFAIPPTGLPNPVNAEDFGFSTGTVTVLGPPMLSALHARSRRVRRGRAATLALRLDQAAEVTLRVERLVPGAGSARRCLTDPASGRRICGRTTPALSERIEAHAGADTVRLGSHLRPGLYVVSALPRAADGTAGARASTVFAVLR